MRIGHGRQRQTSYDDVPKCTMHLAHSNIIYYNVFEMHCALPLVPYSHYAFLQLWKEKSIFCCSSARARISYTRYAILDAIWIILNTLCGFSYYNTYLVYLAYGVWSTVYRESRVWIKFMDMEYGRMVVLRFIQFMVQYRHANKFNSHALNFHSDIVELSGKFTKSQPNRPIDSLE